MWWGGGGEDYGVSLWDACVRGSVMLEYFYRGCVVVSVLHCLF